MIEIFDLKSNNIIEITVTNEVVAAKLAALLIAHTPLQLDCCVIAASISTFTGFNSNYLHIQVSVIDYSLFMKDSNHYTNQCEDEDDGESAMQKLVDQKNYLEERNRFVIKSFSHFNVVVVDSFK